MPGDDLAKNERKEWHYVDNALFHKLYYFETCPSHLGCISTGLASLGVTYAVSNSLVYTMIAPLLFSILATSKFISVGVPICGNMCSGDFMVLPHWEMRQLSSWSDILLHNIILTVSHPDIILTVSHPFPILIMPSQLLPYPNNAKHLDRKWLGANLKVIVMTRPGFEPTRFGFPDLLKWEMDALLMSCRVHHLKDLTILRGCT